MKSHTPGDRNSLRMLIPQRVYDHNGWISDAGRYVVLSFDRYEWAHAAELRLKILRKFIKAGGVVQWLWCRWRQDFIHIVLSFHWCQAKQDLLDIENEFLSLNAHVWDKVEHANYWQYWTFSSQNESQWTADWAHDELPDIGLWEQDSGLHIDCSGTQIAILNFHQGDFCVQTWARAVTGFSIDGNIYFSCPTHLVVNCNKIFAKCEVDRHHKLLRWMLCTIGGMRRATCRSLITMRKVTSLGQDDLLDKVAEVENGMATSFIEAIACT